jgi:RNA polymerase sigma-70 factor (ECF subfamily)
VDESVWIQQARAGNTAAFGHVVRTYQTPVYNLAYRMLGDRMEAEDAAQETFVRVFQKLDQYDPARPLRSWLLAIAANHCVDRLRRRRPTVSLNEALAVRGLPAGNPEVALVEKEGQERIQRLLMELKPVDRALVTLRYWYDCSYEEIAQAVDMTPSAVKSRLHRARGTLALALSEEPDGV